MPNDLRILKYFLWDQIFLKYRLRKMSDLQEFKVAAQSIEDFHQSQVGLVYEDLTACTFTIFDLETTGFFPEIGDEVISIGAIKVKNFTIEYDEAFYTVMQPLNKVPKSIESLTGLSSDILEKAQPFPSGLSQFLDFCHGSVLVAHPATFDIQFLKTVIKQWQLPYFSPEYIDSHVLANKLYTGKRNYLDNLIKRLGITEKERHHALNDAIMTADIFIHLLSSFQEVGVSTIEDLNDTLAIKKKRQTNNRT